MAVRTDPWRGCGSRYMGPQRSKSNGQPTWTLLSLHNEKKSRMDDQRLKPDTAKNTHDFQFLDLNHFSNPLSHGEVRFPMGGILKVYIW